MKKYLILLCLFFFFPFLTTAESDHLLIVEVQIAGQSSSNDFIKIYNPSDADLDISGYKLRKRTSTGSESSIRVFPEGSLIKAKDYFLWANSSDGYAVSISANTESTATLAKDNSTAFLNKDGNTIDAVAWGTNENPFIEGAAFSQNPVANQKLERKQSAGLYEDTNNNSQDFYLNPPLDGEAPPEQEPEAPQEQPSNSSQSAVQNNPPIARAGEDKIALVGQEITFDGSLSSDPDNNSLTFLWNFGQGETFEGAKATTTYQYPGEYVVSLEVSDGSLKNTDQILITIYPTRILVSEFLANPIGKDEEGEWLEIYNPSDFWADLSNWQLDDEEGGSKPFVVPKNTFLKPKSYLVFSRDVTKIAFNNDTDEARVLFPNGEISDRVKYQDNQEGLAGARKSEEIFWTEVLTPGSANFIYLSASENPEKESLLPLTNQPIVESLKNKKTTSLLGDGLPNLVFWPKIADLDDLSLLPEVVLAKEDPEPRSDLGYSRGLTSAVPAKFTAGLSDKLSQLSLERPIKPLVILLSSVILSSFLFGLSLVSWRKKLKSKES
ncbi:MAG: hypothetical protein A2646_03180 [Candidatus Portnoybacteria bacterium RIFCSPHIGHO2_02_FULL_39_12]|nr:MAG: hypothetical protein A2646_03180 [Candidatus Portnoybacteria bacterium RIFCSPHIGHO2_02_FULL_39_12]OGZ39318.1 MAG: hypothetical protein A3F21_02105 [Candidatus Portnoybacteria bacterium RIFCSPLOWO2_01_FULL_38_39]